MWVRLLVHKHLDQEGARRQYSPGDWVEVGKQTGLGWLRSGEAELPSQAARQGLLAQVSLRDCAVVVRGDTGLGREVHALYPDLLVTPDESETRATKLLYYDVAVGDTRLDLWAAAFAWLDRWDVVCPLYSYDRLACDLGTEEERRRTLAVVRDLRVPVYEPGLLWLRRNLTTHNLLAAWAEEHDQDASEPRLAFLRALYRTRPLVLATPPSWLDATSLRRGVRV